MKAFMEEYGVIVVAAIIIMIIVVAASPIGDSIKSGIMEAVQKLTGYCTCNCRWNRLMKISREAWDLKEECFGPLLPYVKDQQVTDINYNGTDVWIEHLKYGYKAPVHLSPEFAGRFSVLISNVVSEQINKFHNVLEAETDTLRISIIHPSVTNTGYSISIRKTPAVMRMTAERMLEEEYCSKEVLLFFKTLYAGQIEYGILRLPGSWKNGVVEVFDTVYPKT